MYFRFVFWDLKCFLWQLKHFITKHVPCLFAWKWCIRLCHFTHVVLKAQLWHLFHLFSLCNPTDLFFLHCEKLCKLTVRLLISFQLLMWFGFIDLIFFAQTTIVEGFNTMMEHNKFTSKITSAFVISLFPKFWNNYFWLKIMCLVPLHQSISIELLSYGFSSDVALNLVQKLHASVQ